MSARKCVGLSTYRVLRPLGVIWKLPVDPCGDALACTSYTVRPRGGKPCRSSARRSYCVTGGARKRNTWHGMAWPITSWQTHG